jgi:two-component system response regulator HydG
MSQATRVMVVDDEATIREALTAWLAKEGYQVESAASGPEALARLSEAAYGLLLVDIKMPGMDGLELVARVREMQPEVGIVMITAHGSIHTAVEAMKLGAGDYLCKPFDPEELSLILERMAAHQALADENQSLREELARSRQIWGDQMVAQSRAMREVFALVDEVAGSDAPVLITGETGTGKEVVARALHQQSRFSAGPFVALNCGAQSESLLESELFGHERGAFTGAVKARRGRLEMANHGTLFLDEVGDISPKMQVGLLRALEDRSFQRVGGSQTVESDFRLISATHRDLPALIKRGLFREDFFYRINVITVEIPALRQRPEDVPLLAQHFLERYQQETGKQVESFTNAALNMLTAYAWPGNVRELRNVIERAVVLAQGRMLGAQELTFLQPGGGGAPEAPVTLKEAEIGHISNALELCGWNITQAAQRLGIDRVTLSRKIKRYNMRRPER